ncbi:hypothetical protein A2Z00_05485 [Candidatus Gottesmanbacteria bacterium RBG_13_45_10]|uniref:Phospholipid/glycerol acyltransferase domain-containing protein n=1 Tax=Candidatus Gottesmanbacteria bacterium RBG_13_45_10 TaxID=1798370 RepID=A0A1F5ZFE7_9BACT|nr:MAG: hypothetical protein A2Z00_05485 [Candidatus Gottesmanbacteria bacterium RBG_13_45_10]
MNANERNDGRCLSPLDQLNRERVARVVNWFIHYEVVGGSESPGLQKARELLQQGVPLVILHDHFGLLETPILCCFIATDPVMGLRLIYSPIAKHQIDNPVFHAVLSLVAPLMNVEYAPIVTKNTLKKPKYAGYSTTWGLRRYLGRAGHVLKNDKGIDIVNPQGGRNSTLGPPTDAMSVFMGFMDIMKVGNYGVLFVGLGVKGVEDYVKKRYRMGTYTITPGPCYTRDEILGDASHEGLATMETVDSWVFDELGLVVPAGYRDPVPLTLK